MGEVVIGGEGWRPEELAAVVAAARELVWGARFVADRTGEVYAVPQRPCPWDPMAALDRPGERREGDAPAPD